MINKFWKYQCQRQWIAISKHKCCNSAGKYSCPIGTKNYNFLNLFKIMVNFIVKAFYMKNYDNLRDWYFENTKIDINRSDNSKQEMIETMVDKIYNMETRVNDLMSAL